METDEQTERGSVLFYFQSTRILSGWFAMLTNSPKHKQGTHALLSFRFSLLVFKPSVFNRIIITHNAE